MSKLKTKSKAKTKRKTKKDKIIKIKTTKLPKKITIINHNIIKEQIKYPNKLILKTGIDIENYLRNYEHESCLADKLLPKRKTTISRKNKNKLKETSTKDHLFTVKENRFFVEEYLQTNFKSINLMDKHKFYSLAHEIYTKRKFKS